jgi:hypothetical protein
MTDFTVMKRATADPRRYRPARIQVCVRPMAGLMK